ncbi:Transmembrane protein [Parasponia andersonii]|uniref:Transmembrane protein n=1 Tax=Parasponia andersonii TaxID=3476 RepID=A0A2P5B7T5_PARAD|nr:Transmembrane protein [Parasponia andersonii]
MADSKNGESSLRCHHCAGPLTKEMETSDWTVRPFIRDSFSMIGSAVGGTTSAFYGFNHGGAVPAVAQLASSSYYATFSSSSLPPTSQDDKIHKS